MKKKSLKLQLREIAETEMRNIKGGGDGPNDQKTPPIKLPTVTVVGTRPQSTDELF